MSRDFRKYTVPQPSGDLPPERKLAYDNRHYLNKNKVQTFEQYTDTKREIEKDRDAELKQIWQEYVAKFREKKAEFWKDTRASIGYEKYIPQDKISKFESFCEEEYESNNEGSSSDESYYAYLYITAQEEFDWIKEMSGKE